MDTIALHISSLYYIITIPTDSFTATYALQLMMTSSGITRRFSIPRFGWSPRPRNRPGGSILKLPIICLWPSMMQTPKSLVTFSFSTLICYHTHTHASTHNLRQGSATIVRHNLRTFQVFSFKNSRTIQGTWSTIYLPFLYMDVSYRFPVLHKVSSENTASRVVVIQHASVKASNFLGCLAEGHCASVVIKLDVLWQRLIFIGKHWTPVLECFPLDSFLARPFLPPAHTHRTTVSK